MLLSAKCLHQLNQYPFVQWHSQEIDDSREGVGDRSEEIMLKFASNFFKDIFD